MSYDVIALACEKLSYRDKLRLAQLLIQLARKEEENVSPQNRVEKKADKIKEELSENVNTIEYIEERLSKLRPVKRKSLENSIKAMYQFQGGISDIDIDKIISELQKRNFVRIEQNNVIY